ncbi:BTAD domain-containing putative transcriptional regulator [Armatimonas sp.]|uniref:AfsR/SARP family transcriptional regulator n=1 Tax=Armatimonas sp. TaxID=1872638 RepID=UPI0037512D13
MTTKAGPIWNVFLLGEVEVHDASGQRVLFSGRHAEALFAYLCLEPGKAHTREALAELLWPIQELTSKRTRLRQELAVLRRLFGTEEEGGALQITRTTVAVVPERILSDWAGFQVAACQLGSPHEEQAVVRILDLYRGPLLTGHDKLVNGHRSEVEEIFERALWRQVFWAREHRKNTDAVTALQRLLVRDPLNLAANTELMRLYQAQGQSGAARRQYQEAERVWQEVLGSAPPAVLTEFLQPLSQFPALPVSPIALHRTGFLWLVVPLFLLAAAILNLALWKKSPPSPKLSERANIAWYYLDHPEPGEKKSQTEASSEGFAVAALRDGRVCVAGVVDTEKEDADILAVFFAPDGTLLKRDRFSGPSHDCDRALSVAAGEPKCFYVAGESYFPEAPGQPEGWRLTLLKYGGEGNRLWSRFSPERIHNDQLVRVVSDGQGGAYLGGTALVAGKRQLLLLHYAANGNLLWSCRTTVTGKEAVFGGLCTNPRGEVFLAGTVSAPNNPNTDWLIVAYNSGGQRLWQKTVDGPGHGADKAGAIQISRFDQVFLVGTLQLVSPAGSVLAVARYSTSGELQGTSWDSEVQPDLRLESAHLSSNGQRLAVAGQFTHADGGVESRVVMFDEVGRLRWKLPLVARKPDRSIAGPRVLADANGAVCVAANVTQQVIFNLEVNGDTAFFRISPAGVLQETQRFSSEDGHPVADLAADVNNALGQVDPCPPVLVGQRHELGKQAALQVISLIFRANP